jgi:hypothetical protein
MTTPVSVLAPVPPLATDNCPVHPAVRVIVLSSELVVLPEAVIRIFVSFDVLIAAPVTSVPAIFTHDIVVPLVVRNLPELPVINGGIP